MSSPKAGFVRRKTLTGKTGLAKATQKKGELATSDKMSSEKKLKEKEKSSDPLQDLIAAVKQQDKKREQPEQAKKKRNASKKNAKHPALQHVMTLLQQA